VRSERSIIKQSFDARERQGGDGGEVYHVASLNADGFGLGWFTPQEVEPCVFTGIGPAWNNRNLHNLASKIESSLIFAHVRAAGPGMGACSCSSHPFEMGRYLFMHNGQVSEFGKIRRLLLGQICSKAFDFAIANGCSDSSVAFAVFIDLVMREDPTARKQLASARVHALFCEMIRLICGACESEGVSGASLLNFVVSDGATLVATRFVHVPTRADAHTKETAKATSLYFASGSSFEPEEALSGISELERGANGSSDQDQNQGCCASPCAQQEKYRVRRKDVIDRMVIVASEPLTESRADWVSIPSNHTLLVSPEKSVLLAPLVCELGEPAVESEVAKSPPEAEFDLVVDRLGLTTVTRGDGSALIREAKSDAPMCSETCGRVTSQSISSSGFALQAGTDALEIKTPEHSMTNSHISPVIAMALYKSVLFSADGASTGKLCAWDLSSRRLIVSQVLENSGGVLAMDVDVQQKLLFVACCDNTIRAWNIVASEKEAHNIVDLSRAYSIHVPSIGHVLSLMVVSDENKIFLGSQDACIRSVELPEQWEAGQALGLSRVLEPDDRDCARNITRFRVVEDRDNRALLRECTSHLSYVNTLVCCGAFIVSGSSDGLLKVWNTVTQKLQARLVGHRGSVLCLCLVRPAPDVELLSGSTDCTIRVWDLQNNVSRRVLHCSAPVLCMARVHGRKNKPQLVSCHANSKMSVWDLSSYQILYHALTPGQSIFCSLSPSSNGTLESSGVQGRLHLQNLLICGTAQGEVAFYETSLPSLGAFRRGSSTSIIGNSDERMLAIDEALSFEAQEEDYNYALIESLRQLVRIRSVSSKQETFEECLFAARVIARLLEKQGFVGVKLAYNEDLDQAEDTSQLPVVLATLEANENPETAKTVIVYGHYDVVDAAPARWDSDPWEMVGKNEHLYGRGVTDQKGPLMAAVFAAKTLHAQGQLKCNVTLIIEGQEESGRGLEVRGFASVVKAHKNLLTQNVVAILISNNYWVGEENPCVTYGMRGVVDMTVRVTGAAKDLHAGVHGGCMLEPCNDLVSILGTLNDSDGRLAVSGMDANVQGLSDSERGNFERIGLELSQYALETGVPRLRSDDPVEVLRSRWAEPSISISSLTTSNATQHVRRIPASAKAGVSVHFVPNQRPEDVAQLVQAHLEEKFVARGSGNELSIRVLQRSDWWLGDTSSLLFSVAKQAVQSVWGKAPLLVREGGSYGGISKFLEETLGAPVLHLPLGQATDNAHLANERIAYRNLINGKDVLVALLRQLGATDVSSTP